MSLPVCRHCAVQQRRADGCCSLCSAGAYKALIYTLILGAGAYEALTIYPDLGADHKALTIYPDPWSRSEIRLRDCVSETYPKAPWMGECAVPPCELTGLCLAGGHHGPLPHDRTVLPWKFRQYRSSLHDAEGEIGNCRQNCVILTPWKKTV